MPVTERTFEQLISEDPERHWELYDGELLEKPAMTFGHNQTTVLLSAQVLGQIDLSRYVVRVNYGHLRRPGARYFTPDLFIIPLNRAIPLDERDDAFEIYADPALLVVEVWSPSTSGYDVDTKWPDSRARGDHEIWRLHPHERTLTRWGRHADSSYVELVQAGGVVSPAFLPGVVIALDALLGT